MKTVSLGIANYCVPCHARCRYCLLCARGQTSGVDGRRGAVLAGRVLPELAGERPEVKGFYYIGYCMDTPELGEYIRFCRAHASPGARFLQMNGFAFRGQDELRKLTDSIRDGGVTLIDLTFYGTEAYHDRFAGRAGDFRFLLKMLEAANASGLPVHISIPLIRENMEQMPELFWTLSGYEVEKRLVFLPHSKGRGRSVQDQRITRREFEGLPEEVRRSFTAVPHRTESEWLAAGEFPEARTRNLNLVLNAENIGRLERMPAGEILRRLEETDDEYLRRMPPPRALAARYGRPENEQLFRLRDLLLLWRQRYIEETGGALYDMKDESHHFSVYLEEQG